MSQKKDTFDMTPTWQAVMPMILEVLKNGTAMGKGQAAHELMDLAIKVDVLRESLRELALKAAADTDFEAPVTGAPTNIRATISFDILDQLCRLAGFARFEEALEIGQNTGSEGQS